MNVVDTDLVFNKQPVLHVVIETLREHWQSPDESEETLIKVANIFLDHFIDNYQPEYLNSLNFKEVVTEKFWAYTGDDALEQKDNHLNEYPNVSYAVYEFTYKNIFGTDSIGYLVID